MPILLREAWQDGKVLREAWQDGKAGVGRQAGFGQDGWTGMAEHGDTKHSRERPGNQWREENTGYSQERPGIRWLEENRREQLAQQWATRVGESVRQGTAKRQGQAKGDHGRDPRKTEEGFGASGLGGVRAAPTPDSGRTSSSGSSDIEPGDAVLDEASKVPNLSTLMLTHVPSHYLDVDLLNMFEYLDIDGIDFIYAPRAGRGHGRYQYVFVNFVSLGAVRKAIRALHGFKADDTVKPICVRVAGFQGLAANFARFKSVRSSDIAADNAWPMVNVNGLFTTVPPLVAVEMLGLKAEVAACIDDQILQELAEKLGKEVSPCIPKETANDPRAMMELISALAMEQQPVPPNHFNFNVRARPVRAH